MFDYIKEDFAREIKEGAFIVINESDSFFSKIGERFPIGLNRIAWENVTEKDYIEVRPLGSGSMTGEELEERLLGYRGIIENWLKAKSINFEEKVYWVGDNTEVALQMTVRMVLKYYPRLFVFGQHSYVVSDNVCWCLNYLIEGELYFALAPK